MQSRTFSFVEQCLNVASGFVIALLVWTYFIIPVFHFEGLSWSHNLSITGIFTIVSIVRGFIWRRIFNWITVNYERNHIYRS